MTRLPINANGVVPKHRTCGFPRSGEVAILQPHHGVLHSAGSGHAPPTCPEGATAQPLQGCCVIGHLPMVAPRRCNHGLCGRIPLGFPEGGFPMPIPAFAGSPPHLRSSAPSVDNPSPFACIGVHSRFVPSLWAPVLALRAGCKPSVPPGTPSTNTHPCKAGPVISIRQTFFPLPEFNPTPLDPPEYHIPPTGHSWIARTSMLTSEAPGWSRTRHSWQHSAG